MKQSGAAGFLSPAGDGWPGGRSGADVSVPKEELHQLLVGLYGKHLLSATMY